MNSPSRRSVLGSAGAIGLGTALGLTAPVRAAESPGQGPVLDTAPTRSALNRPLHGHAGQFRLSLVKRQGTTGRFRVTGSTGREDPGRFDAALAGLPGVASGLRGSAVYAYGLVDVARQAPTHRGRQYRPQPRTAYRREDPKTFRALSTLWPPLT